MPPDATPLEVWRAVPEYAGWYEVSNLGRVRNVRAGRARRAGRILKTPPSRGGYPQVHLRRVEIDRTAYVHALVAAAFLGPRPAGREINHRNGIKTDNSVWNLEYLTDAEHKRHSMEMGQVASGEGKAQAKLTEATVRAIRASVGTASDREIGARFGVDSETVRQIRLRKAWKHVV
jgi:hypothetical protein